MRGVSFSGSYPNLGEVGIRILVGDGDTPRIKKTYEKIIASKFRQLKHFIRYTLKGWNFSLKNKQLPRIQLRGLIV